MEKFRATVSEKVPIKCFVKNMRTGDNVADLKGKYEDCSQCIHIQ